MSPKILQVTGIANELEGASLYFKPAAPPQTQIPVSPTPFPPDPPHSDLNRAQEGGRLSPQASMQASKQAGEHASRQERQRDDFIEAIRKAVKPVGKEELFVRLTPDEKNDLRQVVYQLNELYRGQGRKTSDNEISRIALKFLLEDFHANGDQSILAITQARLNA